jgi:hypothetical protein
MTCGFEPGKSLDLPEFSKNAKQHSDRQNARIEHDTAGDHGDAQGRRPAFKQFREIRCNHSSKQTLLIAGMLEDRGSIMAQHLRFVDLHGCRVFLSCIDDSPWVNVEPLTGAMSAVTQTDPPRVEMKGFKLTHPELNGQRAVPRAENREDGRPIWPTSSQCKNKKQSELWQSRDGKSGELPRN